MQVSIREWQTGDIGKIAALEKQCFSDAWTEEQLFQTFSRKEFCGLLIETDDKRLVGYVCAISAFEDADLLIIAVAETARAQGLGGKLMDALFEKMRLQKVERIFLEVRLSNAAALALYEGRGFTTTRVRKKYYADGEDAAEMVKTL